MTRRALLKLVALVPWAGPVILKALAKAEYPAQRLCFPLIPTAYPKWDPAIDGLSDAWKWVKDIERSRLPKGMVVPRAGEVWVALCDCQVAFQASLDFQAAAGDTEGLQAAFLGSFGLASLRQGMQVRILGVDDPEKPLRVTFQPVRYDEVQEGIMPEAVRRSPGYRGYELSAQTARTITAFGKEECPTYFNETFKLVEDKA